VTRNGSFGYVFKSNERTVKEGGAERNDSLGDCKEKTASFQTNERKRGGKKRLELHAPEYGELFM